MGAAAVSEQRLKLGDVIVHRNNGKRYVVIGWTPRGKLHMRTPTGKTVAAWWPYVSSPPRHYRVERDGVNLT